jgi:hypothetical protein
MGKAYKSFVGKREKRDHSEDVGVKGPFEKFVDW